MIRVMLTSKVKDLEVTGLYNYKELLEKSEEDIVEDLTKCSCQPIGETNVVECNCEDDWSDYALEMTNTHATEEVIVEFLRNLIESMSDCNWEINSIVKYEEIILNEKLYAKTEDCSLYEKQDNFYLEQTTTEMGDYHYGTIIYPISKNQALKLGYNC